MNAAAWKVAGVVGLLLLLMTGCAVWKIQDWRYAKHLANKARIHGARARLTSAHAQLIITDAGAQGLIALQACQTYVRAVVR